MLIDTEYVYQVIAKNTLFSTVATIRKEMKKITQHHTRGRKSITIKPLLHQDYRK
jgi:hypothetical protein